MNCTEQYMLVNKEKERIETILEPEREAVSISFSK
jgi:hypothetical protein